jgi:hypothetical protein
MQLLDCPGWEYKDYPAYLELPARVSSLVTELVNGDLDTLSVATDTRPQHARMFSGMTPPKCDYYAGRYRGELFYCLRHYEVGISTDPRVGCYPSSVEFLMKELNAALKSGLLALDANVALANKDRLHYAILLACHVFVHFLTIHPFANGNGHTGRLIVWCILGRSGFWPVHWTIDPQPPNPPYTQLITLYRNGNRGPLESYIAQLLVP